MPVALRFAVEADMLSLIAAAAPELAGPGAVAVRGPVRGRRARRDRRGRRPGRHLPARRHRVRDRPGAAAAIAAASPTPGGVGAFEAALAAGLTGIGISSGAAVAAVLVYWLATYWLPVVPGWFSWRLLQRMDYV